MCITNLYRQKFEKEIRCPSWESGVWGACGAGDTCVSEGRGGFLLQCLGSSASDLRCFCSFYDPWPAFVTYFAEFHF